MTRHIAPALLARLSEFVEVHLGLHFPSERWPDLQRGVRAASQELGVADAEVFLRGLLAGPVVRREVEVLASHLTVGETYFFREQPSFTALEEHILPELIGARRDQGRRLRLWSAGCCTGEEPYSLAILLSRLLPDPAGWDITLLATDVNPRFLEKAAEGVYREWSFRNAPPWLKDEYFTETPEGCWAILPRIKRMVTFARLNLADDTYPSTLNGTDAVDVIFCRNVLIYMTSTLVQTVMGNFHRALAEGGWLSVSPAETSALLVSEFTTIAFSGTTFYRKVSLPSPPQEGTLAAEAVVSTAPDVGDAVEKPAPAVRREDAAVLARACANAGDLAAAMEWCDKAIAADKLNPAGHYLRATILQEQGAVEEAIRSLRSALYLDHDFVLAHFALGSLARQQGRVPEAEKHWGNALRLLRDCHPDDLVPEADGLTAGRLSDMTEAAMTEAARGGGAVP